MNATPTPTALATIQRVADAASSLSGFSLVSLHADITQRPEEASGNHKFSLETSTGASIIDGKSAEITVTLQVRIHRDEEHPPWATVSTTVRLVYAFSGAVPPKADLEQFAKVNGIYNAWPYLREIVQSTTTRMGIAPLMLPLFRVGTGPKKKKPNRSAR